MSDLRKLAEAATPWETKKVQRFLGGPSGEYGVFIGAGIDRHRLAYIAAASPDVILALLDENERLRAALRTILNADDERLRLPHGNRGIVRRHRVYQAIRDARAALNADV